MRRLNDDLDTSAGGERPKATLVDEGRLWLVKMQARGDRQAMPVREFVTMRLAEQTGLHVAPVKLHTFGARQVLMVQRFDRDGDPFKPTRKLYASAYTALRLRLDAVKGDPERSYLGLADRLRIWTKDGADDYRERLGEQLAELWKRMAFNALVGNTDDHALNTGLLFDRVAKGNDRMVWGLPLPSTSRLTWWAYRKRSKTAPICHSRPVLMGAQARASRGSATRRDGWDLTAAK